MHLARGFGVICAAAIAAFSCSADTGAGGSGGTSGSGQSGTGGGGATTGVGGASGSGGSLILDGGGTTGGTGNVGGECAGITQEASGGVLPADVIWAIDTSPSMNEETEAVRQNMNAFSAQIANAGVDVRIALLAEQWGVPFPGLPPEGICIDAPLGSGQCPGDTNLPKFAHIFQKVSSTNALQLFLSTYPTWQQQLRPGAVKIFVVVTDDNSALSASDFTQQLNALDPANIQPDQWRVYGIFSFTDCPSSFNPGTVYQQLVTQTNGVAGDLCLQNFKPVFDQLASGIVGAAKLDCVWAIPTPNDGQPLDPNKVNVEFTSGTGQPNTIYKVKSAADCGPNGGWYYDDDKNPQNILVCPSTCQVIQADPNGKISIKFGCVTERVPS